MSVRVLSQIAAGAVMLSTEQQAELVVKVRYLWRLIEMDLRRGRR